MTRQNYFEHLRPAPNRFRRSRYQFSQIHEQVIERTAARATIFSREAQRYARVSFVFVIAVAILCIGVLGFQLTKAAAATIPHVFSSTTVDQQSL